MRIEISTGAGDIELASLQKKLPPEEADLLLANREPHNILSDHVEVLLVPGNSPLDSFVGLPQGYFGLNPFEVFKLLTFFHHEFGCELLGVGAQYICLTKSSLVENDELCRTITRFYGIDETGGQGSSTAATELAKSIAANPYVLISHHS